MTNIIVIGAGVVGLGIARQLAARGAKVTILDASSPGGLGSRAAAGVAIPSVKLLEDAQLFELTRLAHPVLKADLASLPDPGLRGAR